MLHFGIDIFRKVQPTISALPPHHRLHNCIVSADSKQIIIIFAVPSLEHKRPPGRPSDRNKFKLAKKRPVSSSFGRFVLHLPAVLLHTYSVWCVMHRANKTHPPRVAAALWMQFSYLLGLATKTSITRPLSRHTDITQILEVNFINHLELGD